jgi:hypothetical protein
MGGRDYFDYYKLYADWNYSAVESPFNTRIISPYLVYLFGKLHIGYDAQIAFSKAGYSPHVYFSAVFVNYVSTVLTCFVIFKTVETFMKNRFIAILSGMTYLLGFGTAFYDLTGLTDAFSSLLFALVVYAYLSKSPYIFVLLLLSIIQREYILMVSGLIAGFDLVFRKQEKPFHSKVLIASVLFFCFYFILRKTVFLTPRWQAQLDIGTYFGRLMNIGIANWGEFFRQTILSQNLLFLYLGILCLKFFAKKSIDRLNLMLVLLLFLQANLINFLAFLGNNGGRCYYMTMPLIMYFAALEARPLLENYFMPGNSVPKTLLNESQDNV